jgi:hypothetical protein
VMLSYGRPLRRNLSIQLSGGGEYSNLRQIGAGGLDRTFWRPKGSVSAAWKPSPSTDVNVRVQRRVGQLTRRLRRQRNLGRPRNAGNPIWSRSRAGNWNSRRSGTWAATHHQRACLWPADRRHRRHHPIGSRKSPGNNDQATRYTASSERHRSISTRMRWKEQARLLVCNVRSHQLRTAPNPSDSSISTSLIHLAELRVRHDVIRGLTSLGASGQLTSERSQRRLY